MALQHLRSSTANKRPVPSGMADGQLAINSNLASPGLFLKDSNGDLVKVGPVHIGTTAPNVSPASGGQAGNSKGEQWLDTASSRYVFKVWDGTAWRTQDGEFVNVTGDTMTGALVMDNQQQVQFRETTANGTNYIALQATASVASDKIITLPDITGTVVTTGDTGSVTSTMILDGTIVDADINASAAIVDTKLATIATAGKVSNSATTATSSGTVSTIVARDSSGNFTAGTITATLAGNASTVTTNANLTGDITSSGNATSIATGAIVNDDVNASAAIAGSKISPNFGSQTVQTTGIFSAAAGTAGAPSVAFTGDTDTGFYSPGVNQAAISTAGTGRLFIDATGNVGIGASAPGQLFEIASASNPKMRFTDTGDYYYDIGITSNNKFSISPAGSPALTVIPAGYVGIGTASPGSALEINAAAATSPFIAKINTAEAARIDSSGRLLVGTSSARSNYSAYGASLAQVEGANNDGARALSVTYGKADAADPIIALGKHRSNSVGGTTVVVDGDGVGQIVFSGSDGTNFVTAATIRAQVDGTPGTNDMPGRLVFSTTSDGASSPTERMRISSAGLVGIGTSAPGGTFHASKGGTLPTVNGTETGIFQWNGITGHTSSVAIVGGSGASSELYFGDGDDIDVGFIRYEHPNNALVFATNAAERLRITSAGVLQIADAGNIQVGTTTGTKIGTATTQKLGFYNATPVVQPTAVANATDAASVITQLNALLAKLRTLGIIAT